MGVFDIQCRNEFFVWESILQTSSKISLGHNNPYHYNLVCNSKSQGLSEKQVGIDVMMGFGPPAITTIPAKTRGLPKNMSYRIKY